MNDETRPGTDQADEIARQAEETQHGILREMVDLLRYNRKWWLAPIIVGLLLASVFIVLGSTAVGPFIYALF
jgi:membrane glycosyltransferase